ncbi:MAG: MarR family winged helix-turn-helix transcriptional regulator [Caulobacteraceae bacterium]
MPIDRQRYLGLANFRYAVRRFLAASERLSADSGITTQQYQAMLAIGAAAEPQAMKALAEELMLQPHAAVQMVDRLQKLGLAERRASPSDGRVVLVALTDKGEDLLDGLAARHLEEVLKQEPRLTEALRRLKRTKGT